MTAKEAIHQLGQSERGLRVLEDFKAMFNNGAKALDSQNQQALITLTHMAVGGVLDFDELPPQDNPQHSENCSIFTQGCCDCDQGEE